MSYENLKKKIDALHRKYARFEFAESLSEQVLLIYQKEVFLSLKILFEKKDWNKNETLQTALKGYLKDNWDRIKGSLLCYTAIPQKGVTTVLCEISEVLAKEFNTAPITLLMPGVATESCHDSFPNLDEIPLNKLLKTHLLGQHAAYLIPVKILHHCEELSIPLINPYFDYQHHQRSNAFLGEEETFRLFNHSMLTQEFLSQLELFNVYKNDKSSLLGHLYELVQKLNFNSTDGVGSEKNAGGGVYAAIIAFNDYYLSIGRDEQKKIPVELYDEIEKLISLSSDVVKNKQGMIDTATCIATRRSELINKMRDNETLLKTIAIKGENKTKLINEAIQNIITTKSLLIEQLDNRTYRGHDPLGLNKFLLSNLDIPIDISSYSDLQDLMTLSAEEITGLCNAVDIKEQITRQFNSIEDLVLFCIETKPAPLKALLSLSELGLKQKFMKKPQDVISLLIILDPDRATIICEAFKVQLQQIITNPEDFIKVFKHLTDEQGTALCHAFNDGWLHIIKSSNDFKMMINYLTDEQCTVLCHSFKDQWLHIIKKYYDLIFIFEDLGDEQYIILFNALKDHWPQITQNGYEVIHILNSLKLEVRILFFDAYKNQWPLIIKSNYDFISTLKSLNPEERILFCNAFKENWSLIIKDNYDFIQILKSLTRKERSLIYDAFKNNWQLVIKDAYEFSAIIKYLSPKQGAMLCNAYKDQWVDMIKTCDDFIEVLNSLGAKQRIQLFDVYKGNWLQIINTSDDFTTIFKQLTSRERILICDAFKYKWIGIIHNALDFNLVLGCLSPLGCFSPKYCAIVYDTFKGQWPNIIERSLDFEYVLEHLTSEQRTPIYNAFNNHWSMIINHSKDLNSVLRYLTPKQCTAVCHALKNKLQKVVQKSMELNNVLKNLTLEQSISVCNSLKDHFPSIVQSSEDVRIIFSTLKPEQCSEVGKLLKDRLAGTIQHSWDFVHVVACLGAQQRTEVFNILKDKLPFIIKNWCDFKCVLKFLAPEQCTTVCNVIKDRLPLIFKNNAEFRRVLQDLTPDQCSVVYSALKYELPKYIINNEGFIEWMKWVNIHNPQNIQSFINAIEIPLFFYINDIKRDLPKISESFQLPVDQRHFLSTYLKSLIRHLKQLGLNNNITISQLEKTTLNFCGLINPSPDMYAKFQRACHENLCKLKAKFTTQREVVEGLNQLALAIATLDIILFGKKPPLFSFFDKSSASHYEQIDKNSNERKVM